MSIELHDEIAQSLNKFRLAQIEPLMEADDEQSLFRKELFQAIGNLGFGGMTVHEKFGGAGLGYEAFIVALEELAKSSAPYAVTLSVSAMTQSIIERFGNDTQKEKYLPELTSGSEIGAFALSESSSGSDAAALKTTAKKVKGGYLINGNKLWITSGGVAKTYIVMARTGGPGAKGISAFIIQDGSEGFKYGKKEKKMGWKTSPTRELIFENCFVSEENLLASEGMGFTIAMDALDRGRITIGSIAVGLSQRCLDDALVYSLERSQFERPIFEFQGLQFMMADMAVEIEASRLLVQKAAHCFDKNIKNSKIASMAKLKATDTAMKVSTDAVQILGGVGYTTEYPLERFMRDAKVLQIVEGTNQIQRIVIARNLKREYES